MPQGAIKEPLEFSVLGLRHRTRQLLPEFQNLEDVQLSFATTSRDARSSAIRIEVEDSNCWRARNVAILLSKEARIVRFMGSLVFERPLQYGSSAGAEVRALLPGKRFERWLSSHHRRQLWRQSVRQFWIDANDATSDQEDEEEDPPTDVWRTECYWPSLSPEAR